MCKYFKLESSFMLDFSFLQKPIYMRIYDVQIAGKVSSVKTIVYKKYFKQIEFTLLIEATISNNNECYIYILDQRCIADYDLLNTILFYEKAKSKVLINGIFVRAYSTIQQIKEFDPYIKVTTIKAC